MTNKIAKGFAHLFLVVVIVIIGIGGLLYYSWQKGLIKTSPTQEVPPAPIYTQEDTSDWKTYFNEEYSISFQYPPEWHITEYPSASPVSVALTPSPYSSEVIADAPRQDGVYIHYNWTYDRNVNPIRKYNSITDAVDHYVSFVNPKSLIRNNFKVSDKEAVTIQGTTETDNMWTNNQPVHTTYVQLENEVLIISLSGKYQEIYNQILSTFKFIE